MKMEFSSRNILFGITIVVIIIGLITITAGKKETPEVYDTTAVIKIITESKIKIENKSDLKSKGKIVPPASQYEINQIRKSLNLPEEEEKDSRRQDEETLKKNPETKFIF